MPEDNDDEDSIYIEEEVNSLHDHTAAEIHLRGLSVAQKGVDPNIGGPTAADEVWSAYLKAHPDASEFRGKPFVLFGDLDSIFTGKVATGKYSKSSMTPSPVAIPREKRQRDSSGDESWLKGGNDEDAMTRATTVATTFQLGMQLALLRHRKRK